MKGRLTRRELAEGTSGIPMLAARVARCEVLRPRQRDIPTFAAKECLGGELAEHMPTFLRNPYGISRGILRACPAGFLGHAPRSPHGMPRGVFDLLTDCSRSPRSPHAPHGILTASPWRSFPSSAQSFTMSSPRVFEACSTPPAFVTFVNPAAFIASSANPERRPERQ